MIIRDLFEPFGDELQLRPTPRFPTPPTIEWRAAFGDFFFRLKGAEPQLLWCDLGYSITTKRPLPPPRPTTLAKRVSRAFRGRNFFRVVPFANGDDWLLLRPKRAVVKSPHNMAGALWKWKSTFDTPTLQLDWLSQQQSWFEAYLERHKDDISLQEARDCAALSEDERKWNPNASGEAARWEKLVCALLILAIPNETSSLRWSIATPTNSEGSLLPICSAYKSGMTIPPFPPPAKELLRLLQDNLRIPFWHAPLWRALNPRGERAYIPVPSWTFEGITQHERLESLMLWHDFGREIGKSREVETVLLELSK